MTVVPEKPLPVDLNGSIGRLSGESLAVMLYGSHARGDAGPESDVDLLQLVPHSPRSYIVGSTTVVAYTPEQISEMAIGGSLFAWHLRTEGVIMQDTGGLLRGALDLHSGPAWERVLSRITELAVILDLGRGEFEQYADRVIRTARYLVRTAVYARAIGAGGTSFAMESAARKAGYPHLMMLLRRGAEGSRDWQTFVAYRDALAELTGTLRANPHGSLEALAVCAWGEDQQLASLTIQTIIPRDGEIEYSSLPPPVL